MPSHITHHDDCGCLSQKFKDLLAIIHRDDGHYTAKHGIEKSAKDAQEIVARMRMELEPVPDENPRGL